MPVVTTEIQTSGKSRIFHTFPREITLLITQNDFCFVVIPSNRILETSFFKISTYRYYFKCFRKLFITREKCFSITTFLEGRKNPRESETKAQEEFISRKGKNFDTMKPSFFGIQHFALHSRIGRKNGEQKDLKE